MPTFSVSRDHLFSLLGERFTNKKFDEICFDFGIEMEWTSPTVEKLKEKHKDEITKAKKEGKEFFLLSEADVEKLTDIEYKIEVGANRYDLLSTEGLARALKLFLGKEKAPPKFDYSPPKSAPLKMVVKKETKLVRPIVVCAVLRNITFTHESYESFIGLQEKLHQNICKKRKLVAIGTHDLDTLEAPFTYEALPPSEISFIPLNQTQKLNGADLVKFYKGSHLEPYLEIISSSPVYPVIYDNQRRVLSLPPIINGEHSKITKETKNVFIECTALDHTKAHIVLNTIITNFSQYCSPAFLAERVEVVDSDGKSSLTPDLSTFDLNVSVKQLNSGIGIQLKNNEIPPLLARMGLVSQIEGDDTIKVTVPPWRSDVFHACDVLEDLAVSYGFNKINTTIATIPPTPTIGRQQPLNKLTDLLRTEVALAGYTEVLNFAMSHPSDNFQNLRREDDGRSIKVDSHDFPTVRNNLLAGLLQVVHSNMAHPLPLRLFEVGDVVFLDPTKDVGARNQRNLIALYCDTRSGFEVIHGLLHRVMQMLQIPLKDKKIPQKSYYHITASKEKTLFDGRQATVHVNDKPIGYLGVVHPEVLKAYKVDFPCSVFEINMEQFV